MDRRQFLQLGSAVAAAGALSPAMAQVVDPRLPRRRIRRSGRVNMTIAPYDSPAIDGKLVFANLFEIEGEDFRAIGRRGLHPVIWMTEGETLEISITNRDDRPHSFAVTGMTARMDPVEKDQTGQFTIAGLPPGSYLYHDPHNWPVNRILGLNGALIVLPRAGTKTSCVETSNSAKCSSAFHFTSISGTPRIARCTSSSKPSNCRIT